MKAIVGIDSNGAYKHSLDLIARLRFTEPHLTLLHAVPSAAATKFPDARCEAEYARVLQNQGLALLDAAVDEACGRDLMSKTKLVFGKASDCLISESEQSGADLLALTATHRGSKTQTFSGSTHCACAMNATVPLLIAKGPVQRTRDFVVVLAVDHSSTCQRWLDRFIELAPKGITRLHVVSAYEVDDETATATHHNLAMIGGDVERWLVETITEKTQAVVKRLTEAGYNVTFNVQEGPALDAIHKAMEEQKANLLVLGVHGNKQAPGTMLGSVALHELIAEPFPIFLVRP